MADDTTMEPGQTVGEPIEGAGAPTQTGPEGMEGQSTTSEPGTTNAGPQGNDTVFDPGEFNRLTKELPPELQAQAASLQKNLQRAYTKKFQEIAEGRKKIEAYDAFSNDPVTQLQRMAQQMGYKLTRGQAEIMSNERGIPNDWEPQSWDDVLDVATKRAEQNLMQKLSPLFNEMQSVKKNSIESQLSEIDPTWTAYEDKMMDNLKAHPTLANDPSMLYRLSVPSEVLESRATQKALAKMKAKMESGKISGGSTTTKTMGNNLPDKKMSFQEAVNAARKNLAEQGIAPPS